MQFNYNAKNAAYVRQHGRCAKCGKHFNMLFEDKEGYEGSWTGHDLMPLEEGGSNRAYNCVLLCITKPNCHLNFAHGGDLGVHTFMSQFKFPYWISKNGTDQAWYETEDGQRQ